MPRVTACSTLAFALSSLQTALEHIAGYGFDRVEIADMLTTRSTSRPTVPGRSIRSRFVNS